MFLSCADGGEVLGQSALAKRLISVSKAARTEGGGGEGVGEEVLGLAKRLISVAKAVQAEVGGEGGGGCGMGYGGGGDVVGLERN